MKKRVSKKGKDGMQTIDGVTVLAGDVGTRFYIKHMSPAARKRKKKKRSERKRSKRGNR